jgi:hypothetical protein
MEGNKNTPVIVADRGDIDVFSSVDALRLYLETEDVMKGEFEVYDAEGRLLRVYVDSDEIVIEPSERDPTHSKQLTDALIRFLSTVGFSDDWLVKASLAELVKEAVRFETKNDLAVNVPILGNICRLFRRRQRP